MSTVELPMQNAPSRILIRLKPREYHLAEFTRMVEDIESLIVLASWDATPEDYPLWLAPVGDPDVALLAKQLETLRGYVSRDVTIQRFSLTSPVEVVITVFVIAPILMQILNSLVICSDSTAPSAQTTYRYNEYRLLEKTGGPSLGTYDEISSSHPKKMLNIRAARAMTTIECVDLNFGRQRNKPAE